MKALLADIQAGRESLVEAGDELKAQQRLNAGEHHPGLVQHLLHGIFQRQHLTAMAAGRQLIATTVVVAVASRCSSPLTLRGHSGPCRADHGGNDRFHVLYGDRLVDVCLEAGSKGAIHVLAAAMPSEGNRRQGYGPGSIAYATGQIQSAITCSDDSSDSRVFALHTSSFDPYGSVSPFRERSRLLATISGVNPLVRTLYMQLFTCFTSA